jgi:hypothetical protein
MIWSHWLNVFGLVLGAIAAFLMAWYPPRVQTYTEDGRTLGVWVGKATEEGKAIGKRQAMLGKIGPRLLGVGFLFQLAAAGIG